MMTDATTLMGREETVGKRYPLWIERLLFLGAIVTFVFGRSAVADTVSQPVASALLTYIAFPLILLAGVELLGRALQASMRS
ncbi:MAG: hypothetical protein VXY10_02040 [Candidatus Thermoplasmatota archaeon]|nr:hypothetical protein [Candidatus Thermoplasmatota archaeon]MEC8680684.1 hypothetical protein [Candidatus Thermoplasmatota archaeon]